jgi:glycosyltransferase involved in cell wall biosynthesis
MNDRPLKVLTLATDYLPNIGGISNHIHYLNLHLTSLGVQPRVLHLIEHSDKDGWEEHDNGYPVHRYHIRDSLSDWRKLKYRRVFRRILQDRFSDVDILHTHELLTTEYLVDTNRYPWVWTNHTSQFPKLLELPGLTGRFKRGVERRILRKSDLVICVSQQRFDQTRSWFGAGHPVRIIPNGISTERFSTVSAKKVAALRQDLGIGPEDKVILIPARWAKVKGIDLAVNAMQSTEWEQAGRVVWLFVGSGLGDTGYREEVYRLLGNSSLHKLVETAPYDDMPLYYDLADIVLVPSRYESFSIVVLEAMAAQRPVVAPRIGGPAELIRDGETGLLYETENVEEMVSRLKRAVSGLSDGTMSEMAGRAFAEAAGRYDWRVVAAAVRAGYEDVLDARTDR